MQWQQDRCNTIPSEKLFVVVLKNGNAEYPATIAENDVTILHKQPSYV